MKHKQLHYCRNALLRHDYFPFLTSIRNKPAKQSARSYVILEHNSSLLGGNGSHRLHCCRMCGYPPGKRLPSMLNVSGSRWVEENRRFDLLSRRIVLTSQLRKFQETEQVKKTHAIPRRSMVVRVMDLEKYLKKGGSLTLYWAMSILGLAGFAIYMFREPIKVNLSDEVADVASRSLGDENVVLRANAISKEIVNQVLTDPGTQVLAAQFVTELLQNEQLLKKAVIFSRAVINDGGTQAAINSLAERSIQRLLADPRTKQLILNFVESILFDVHTKKACQDLLSQLTADKETKQLLAAFFQNVLKSETVKNEAVSLGKNVTKQVITDSNIQEETGVALWGAVKKMFIPSWFHSSEVEKAS